VCISRERVPRRGARTRRIDRQSLPRAAQVSCRPCEPNDATQKADRRVPRSQESSRRSWLTTETLSNGTVQRFPGGKLPAGSATTGDVCRILTVCRDPLRELMSSRES
jgi:hypothetical protein